VPVWHDATRALRESGQLAVIGITEEQHPARCRLFAQWHGIDWPILWDPFNMTGSHVVPRFTLIDEHGVVRSTKAKLETLHSEFVDRTFPAVEAPARRAGTGRELVAALTAPNDSPAQRYYEALSSLLWRRAKGPGRDGAVRTIEAFADAHPQDAAARWRLGVAYRMRHDAEDRKPGDFQAALDHWAAALAMNPKQYIYRRRIQQYGPRLDKPYPFYGWIDDARAAIAARGEQPVTLEAPLSGAERNSRPAQAPRVAVEPDPEGALEAPAGLVEVETAVVWHTDATKNATARVHLLVRAAPGHRIELDGEAGPVTVWIAAGEGCTPRDPLHEAPVVAGRPQGIDFEVDLAPGRGAAALRGYVLYHACVSDGGACKYLRQDFTVAIPRRP
jgi:hypothetical protein